MTMVARPNEAPAGLRTLIVDDEKNIRATLSVCLEGFGCSVTAVGTSSAALAALANQPFDLAFVDIRLAQENGLDLIPKLLATSPELSIVVITAYATFDTAVEAIRRGARDYLPKPFTPGEIRHVVDQISERRALGWRVADLEQQVAQATPEAVLTSDAPAMRTLLETLSRAARSDASVLLRGESGTGKGVLARAIHVQSDRLARPFVVVNCPTLSEELLTSELFGHAMGAFTGAVRDQPGRVESAEGGTLFLDEIGELSPALQAKLLRFIQEKQFERVGESKTRRADVRLVVATNRDLESDVAAGRFREDLLYRLNVVELKVPPLRERPEDILPLARRFLEFFGRAAKRPLQELSPAACDVLRAQTWPGNIRELRNVMERVTILWPAAVVEPAAFPDRMAPPTLPSVCLGGDFSVDEVEREHIRRVLARVPTQEEAAKILGVDTSTLWRKKKKST
jgi:two-component system, NtrC family, response regulator AlgB